MIQIVREAGGVPFIGDSPAIGSLIKSAEKSGIKAVAEEMNCPLVEFDKPVIPPKGGGKYLNRWRLIERFWKQMSLSTFRNGKPTP